MANVAYEVQTNDAASQASIARVDMKFEIVVIPVSDVDRAKEFYGRLRWRLDADFASGDDFHVIQFTPPGSGCSVQFGTNLTSAPADIGSVGAAGSPCCRGRSPTGARRGRENLPRKTPAASAPTRWVDRARGSVTPRDESCRKWFSGGLRIASDEYVCKAQRPAGQR